jgi:hypothetical protein
MFHSHPKPNASSSRCFLTFLLLTFTSISTSTFTILPHMFFFTVASPPVTFLPRLLSPPIIESCRLYSPFPSSCNPSTRVCPDVMALRSVVSSSISKDPRRGWIRFPGRSGRRNQFSSHTNNFGLEIRNPRVYSTNSSSIIPEHVCIVHE